MEVIKIHLGDKYPLIKPFERSEKKTIQDHLKEGEMEIDVCEEFIHHVKYNGDPPRITKLSLQEIEELRKDHVLFRSNKDRYRDKCFLWVIDNSAIKIVREKTRNIKRIFDPEYICHTNLTNAGEAYIGGEIFFGEDGHFYINFFSDRYGSGILPDGLWDATKKVFIELGYVNLVDILETCK